MPNVVMCPSCSRRLRVPDQLAGKRIKCPSCGTAFAAIVPDEKPEEEPYEAELDREEAPRPRRRPAPARVEDEEEDSEREREEDEPDEPSPRRRRRRRNREAARAALTWPAIGLMIAAGLTLAWSIYLVLSFLAGTGPVAEALKEHQKQQNRAQPGLPMPR